MTLAEALETTRIHRVAGLTGAHTAFVTTRLLRVLHHMLVGVWLRGNEQIRMPGESRWRTEKASRHRLATLASRPHASSVIARTILAYG
jgi:hypothetical protein